LIELFDKYVDWKILAQFFKHPGRQFHIKEISRLVKVSPSSAHAAVKSFEKWGYLEKEIKGPAHFYRLNTENSVVASFKKGYGIACILESDPVAVLKDVDENTISLSLYGSYANGTYDDKSDVDLLLVTNTKKDKFNEAVKVIEARLEIEVNVTILKLSEWERLAFKKDPFYLNLIENHVLLYGSGIRLSENQTEVLRQALVAYEQKIDAEEENRLVKKKVDEIMADIQSGKHKTYSWDEIKKELGLK